MKSSRLSRIHKEKFHGIRVDKEKVRLFIVGDIVLVAHGRGVGSLVKWP